MKGSLSINGIKDDKNLEANEEQRSKSKGMSRDSEKGTKVVCLVENLYKNYPSIYEQYFHLRDEKAQ